MITISNIPGSSAEAMTFWNTTEPLETTVTPPGLTVETTLTANSAVAAHVFSTGTPGETYAVTFTRGSMAQGVQVTVEAAPQ
jgi:hypothetical protein